MKAILCLVLFVAIAVPCGAAPADGAPPPPPFGAAPNTGARNLAIGPKDWDGAARKVRGNMMLVAVVPQNTTPASVEFYLDDKSVGSVSQKPFKLAYDASSVAVGDHVFKAVALDADGKQLWSAKTNVSVLSPDTKGGQTAPRAPGGKPGVNAGKPTPPTGGPAPDKPGAADRPKNKKKIQPSPQFPLPAGCSLDRDYNNADYGFSVRYPGKWTFLDQSTTMNPRNPGDFWIAFGEYPVEKAKIVVNIRRVAQKKGTTAESFAKYNNYVQKWESRDVLGSPAFFTTAKASNSVTHRMIVIKDGYALMMNCIDSSGKPSGESRGIFENMVASIGDATQEQAKPKRGAPPAL